MRIPVHASSFRQPQRGTAYGRQPVCVRSLAVAAVVAGLAIAGMTTAQAQIYSCRDRSGRFITSDRPSPECANVQVNELTRSGLVRREIPAPLTAEQKAERDRDNERKRVEGVAREQRAQQDRSLLARYRSESDIESARRYYLGLAQDLLKRDEMVRNNAQNDLQAARREAEAYQNGSAYPLQIRKRIENARIEIADAERNIAQHQKDMASVNARFDDTLLRYRQLIATGVPE